VGERFWDRRDIYSGGPLDTAGDRPSSPPPRYNSRTEQVANRQDTAGDRPFSPPQLQQQTRAGSRQTGNISGNKFPVYHSYSSRPEQEADRQET
jgi:hypothetical protein